MEVKFHLPGLRRNYPLNVMFAGLLKGHPEFFREGVTIGSCFGEFPTSLWNAGRNSTGDQCNLDYVKAVVKSLNDCGIPVRFTYTSMVLDEDDLYDSYCNFCLKTAHNEMNGVILVSPLLEEYVRKNYPKMKVISSTCKCIRDIEGVNAELEKGYDIVVLDYNFNNRYEELEKITDKDRCEILVNSSCTPNCAARSAHYKNVAENQKRMLQNRKLPADKQVPPIPWEYKLCSGKRNIYTIKDFCTYVSPEDIWEKYVPMGFKNFKIEGRTDDFFSVLEAYCHYMVKPEYQGLVRTQVLRNMQEAKIVQVNLPNMG